MRWIEYYDDQRSFSKIMNNILGAAYHLSVLRADNSSSELNPALAAAGLLCTTSLGLGGLAASGPDAIDDQALSAGTHQSNDVEAFTNGVPLKERLPLHLAVCVSPLYLLIPSIIMKKSFRGRNIVDVSNIPGAARSIYDFPDRHSLHWAIANLLPSYPLRRRSGKRFSAWRMAHCNLKICCRYYLSRFPGTNSSPARRRIGPGSLSVG
jgi:hypothetical protein